MFRTLYYTADYYLDWNTLIQMASLHFMVIALFAVTAQFIKPMSILLWDDAAVFEEYTGYSIEEWNEETYKREVRKEVKEMKRIHFLKMRITKQIREFIVDYFKSFSSSCPKLYSTTYAPCRVCSTFFE